MKILKLRTNENIPRNYTGMIEYTNGDKFWFKNKKHHRLDGPAIIWFNGTKQWLIEGKLHREDGPACEFCDGTKEWWVDGSRLTWRLLDLFVRKGSFLGKEKGKYSLEWLRFFTEEGIKEFPVIPGMETERNFIYLFTSLNKKI